MQHIPDINSFQAGKVNDKAKYFFNISVDFIFKVINFLSIKMFLGAILQPSVKHFLEYDTFISSIMANSLKKSFLQKLF